MREGLRLSYKAFPSLKNSGTNIISLFFLHDLMIGTEPDLTLLFDLNPAEGLARANARAGIEMRFEDMGLQFQTAARAGFLALSKRFPDRFRVIDGGRPMDQVAAEVWKIVQPELGLV